MKENTKKFIYNRDYINSIRASKGSKNCILIIEDHILDQEMLKGMLRDTYEVQVVNNGLEALEKLEKEHNAIQLVLLNLYNTSYSSFTFLENLQEKMYVNEIPILVTTNLYNAEDIERCMKLGVRDSLTKPYSKELLLEKIQYSLLVQESFQTLSVVEYDMLTGLYTQSAFLFHVQETLKNSLEKYTITLVELPDLTIINQIHGERTGDEILTFIARHLCKNFSHSLIGRNGNEFYICTPTKNFLTKKEMKEHLEYAKLYSPVPNMRIRVGVYSNVEKDNPPLRLCDQVKLVVKSNRDHQNPIVYYNKELQHQQIIEQKLLSRFNLALKNEEFLVYLQPKVDSRTGKIIEAEALVRWKNEKGEFISPGIFVPLLEREGYIKSLDEFMYKKVCAYQKRRLEKGLPMIPISINLSRNSLFFPGVVQTFKQILVQNNLCCEWVPIEITETAATTDQQIEAICTEFVQEGFSLQMDDFGSGYSSLASLTTLPFHVMKIDKSLIDKIDTQKGKVILKNVIQTAKDLNLFVEAEGVETKEQVEYLASLQCYCIQGYYYSEPVSIPAFDHLMKKGRPFEEKSID